jgi:predicted neutral ceramidase superfamily lipid hydrolase
MTAGLTVLLVFVVMVGVRMNVFDRPGYFPGIIFFVAITTLIIYGMTSRKVNRAPQDFISIYLTGTVVRILLFGASIAVLIYLDQEGATANAMLFLVSYLFFTILEVAVLWQEVNAKKSPEMGQKDR